VGQILSLKAVSLGLLALACGAPEDRLAPAFATLMPSCAPWDGPAVTLFLTSRPTISHPVPPYSAIMVYRSVTQVLGRRFEVSPMTPNLGVGQVCPLDGDCSSSDAAWVNFGGLNPDSTLEITYSIEQASGPTSHGRVRARFHPNAAFCG
jgi:hypothetical protein